MPKYENSIIYKLCHQNDLENNNIYIGSTTNFRTRKNNHKFNCNNENNKKYNYPVYQFIRNNGDWSEWKMIPIEKYPCNGKEELKIRERYYIEFFKSKLNQIIPTRTHKQWYVDNKEKLQEYEKNRPRLYNGEKSQYDKKYYEANKEKILEKTKQYSKANKDIISEKRKEKVVCDHCGSEIRKYDLNRHKKTNKCKNYNITKE